MKKIVLALSVLQTLFLVGCGGQQPMPGQVMPGYANGGYGTGTGYTNGGYATTDPYANGGYSTGGGYATTDPYGSGYGAGTGYTNTDPYGSGYGTGTGYTNTDPYGSGYGAGTGYTNGNTYGAGTGYTNGAYGSGTGYVNGAPQIDPMTGQPVMVSNVSQSIVSKIQAAGGVDGLKSDDVVRDALKSISITQALGQSPLDHRSLIIKALLEGYASEEDRNYARQVWNTILPQDQQTLMSQDSDLNDLITKKLLKDSSGGLSSILGSAGKLIGIGS